MLEKILVPLDGSELSERILKQVARLAGPKREVQLVRALHPFAVDDALLRGSDLVHEAREYLERLARRLARGGSRTGQAVLIGDPAEMILQHAALLKPALIVMSTHGRSGADRWVRGSVAERVLRRSPFPLLLSNPRAADARSSFRKILVPLDGSETSAVILPLALEVARRTRGELLLLHVIEPRPAVYPVASLTEKPEEARAMLDGHGERLRGVKTRSIVARGSPAYAILSTARKEKADLVAMTTHGRSGPSRWVFGSVAEHVLHQCRAPLLVQRTSGLAEGVPSEDHAQGRTVAPLAERRSV